MSDSKCKKIVTEGDSLANTITVLGELVHVATRLTSIVIHLREFVTNILQDKTTSKRIILKQVRLIEISSEYTEDHILFLTVQSSNIAPSKQSVLRKRAATNLSLK